MSEGGGTFHVFVNYILALVRIDVAHHSPEQIGDPIQKRFFKKYDGKIDGSV